MLFYVPKDSCGGQVVDVHVYVFSSTQALTVSWPTLCTVNTAPDTRWDSVL